MITFHVLYDEDKDYLGFRVSGHAKYADFGKDIICAAVSAVTFGMINSVLEFTDTDVIYEAGVTGLLKFKFAEKPDKDAKLLFESMLLTIQNIEKEYGRKFLRMRYIQKLSDGKYISIDNQEV